MRFKPHLPQQVTAGKLRFRPVRKQRALPHRLPFRSELPSLEGPAPLITLLLCVLLILCGFAAPSRVASAQGAELSSSILLGFKQTYGTDKKQHLGIDVAYAPDAELCAPVSGTISFKGRVPGSAGLNVTALTIKKSNGDLITLNPFAYVSVAKGDAISKGQVLGTLSGTGDPSSSASHVHLSLRVNSVYKDPSNLIAPTVIDTKVLTAKPRMRPSTSKVKPNVGAQPVTQTVPATRKVTEFVRSPHPAISQAPKARVVSQRPAPRRDSVDQAVEQQAAEPAPATDQTVIRQAPKTVPAASSEPLFGQSLFNWSPVEPMFARATAAAAAEMQAVEAAGERLSPARTPSVLSLFFSQLSSVQLAGILLGLCLMLSALSAGIVVVVRRLNLLPALHTAIRKLGELSGHHRPEFAVRGD